MSKSIIRQVIDLQHKTSAELREIYEMLFSEAPHYNATKNHLKPKIAYRMQELALGGLNNDTKDKLERIAGGATPATVRPHTDLLPGTKICREWNGVMHEVEVKKNCFEYQGKKYRSLSAVAREITGTRWNGPRFFKLRKNA